jgi:Putative prokaryotic signal transducing protein
MADSNQGFPEDVNTVPAEDGTTWVEIASMGTDDEARLMQGFLEAEGIPAQIENVKFSMEPVTFGTMGEIRVYVGAEDEQRAQELLRSRDRQAENLDDDEETLVTDEGPALIDESAQAVRDDGSQS